MYTEENMEYNDNYDNNYNDDKMPIGKLLVRILIIFVCLLLAIWLISKIIGGKKVVNDGTVFNNNLENIHLASEKYFFIENHLPKENETITISLKEMNKEGLIEEVYDYQNKACSTNENESFASLTKTASAYELTIKLTCSEEQKEVTYHYDLETYKCLSCTGNTYMDGSLVLDNEDETNNDSSDNNNNNNSNDNNDNDNNEDNSYQNLGINCNSWSDWTTIKLDDKNLEVRTRTLYKGYKTTESSEKIIYGPWSEYSETVITPSDTLEVEVKQEYVNTWSENKTTTSYISDSDTIRVIDTNTTGGERTCKTVKKEVRATITASEYAKYNSQGLIVAVHNKFLNPSRYDVTYIKKSQSCSTSDSITIYTYQELISTPVNYYRSRTITKEVIQGETIYTNGWVEKLEEGYTKTDELVEYSYKEAVCSK